ncbi:MAG TPA: hypothetical protein PKM43_13535 [Verrucomicrobiota bacterium]|nr:hypothetical protein [Verrucomicrobiota bacterium]
MGAPKGDAFLRNEKDRSGDWGGDGAMELAVTHGAVRPLDGMRHMGMQGLAAARGVKRRAQALRCEVQK